jgi:CIC family chloride channel protein
VKFFGGALAIGSGLALGREGPTVQMGGTIGRLLSDLFRPLQRYRGTLIAASAGAGLAVAFNAPLAAVIFVVEELLHRFSARVLSATLMACISGTVVLRVMLGNTPDFGVPHLDFLPSHVLPEYLLLGALAGFLGVVGATVGLLMWFAPSTVGDGENVAQFAINGHAAFSVIAGLLVVRFLLTMASYGSGAPGGIFAPLLALGALLGTGFAGINAHLHHVQAAPSAFAIVAMAACFTAIVRSPLTGVVLLLEMTGSWTLILPMMAASVTAYAIPELMGNPPIYDSLRDRDVIVEKR